MINGLYLFPRMLLYPAYNRALLLLFLSRRASKQNRVHNKTTLSIFTYCGSRSLLSHVLRAYRDGTLPLRSSARITSQLSMAQHYTERGPGIYFVPLEDNHGSVTSGAIHRLWIPNRTMRFEI